MSDIVRKLVYGPVSVRDGEKVTSIPAIEAVLLRLRAEAAKGNRAAIRDFLRLYQLIEAEDRAQDAASTDAEEVARRAELVEEIRNRFREMHERIQAVQERERRVYEREQRG